MYTSMNWPAVPDLMVLKQSFIIYYNATEHYELTEAILER